MIGSEKKGRGGSGAIEGMTKCILPWREKRGERHRADQMWCPGYLSVEATGENST